MTPKRIQLRRTKGWRKPEGAVTVARPTMWGNPFAVVSAARCRRVDICCADGKHWHVLDNRDGWVDWIDSTVAVHPTRDAAIRDAVDRYREGLHWLPIPDKTLSLIRGKDLACWCPLDQPCHADVLLEIANAGSA